MIMMIKFDRIASNSIYCYLAHKCIFGNREERQQTVKTELGKTQNQVERQAQKSRWFQSFCPRRFMLIENTKRERWVESGNANCSSALPLLCFRNVERGTRRSFNSHHQHRAMLANLTAQSNNSWHTGSFTPSNIFFTFFCVLLKILFFSLQTWRYADFCLVLV